MKHISSLISPIYADLGLEEKVILKKIESNWQTLFNSPLSLHTYPFDFKNGELIINVDSSAWLQQIKYMQAMFLQKLSDYPVKSIKLRIGKIKKDTKKQNSLEDGKAIRNTKLSLSKDDEQWIEDSLTPITDIELRETIKKGIEKSLIYQYKK